MATFKGIQSAVLKFAAVAAVVFLAGATSSATETKSKRVPMDANDPDRRYAAEVLQPIKDKSGKVIAYQSVGNAFFIGDDGCHLSTNVHVVLSGGRDEKGNVKLIENADVGHEVIIAYDHDPATKRFRQRKAATVIELGEYEAGTDAGFRGDKAALRLKECAGPKFSGPKFVPTVSRDTVYAGELKTITVERVDEQNVEIMVLTGCRAAQTKMIGGGIITNCDSKEGDSGSLTLANGIDRFFVGMTTGGFKGSVSSLLLDSRMVAEFFKPILGDLTAGANVAGQPQGNDTVATAASPRPAARTVVR